MYVFYFCRTALNLITPVALWLHWACSIRKKSRKRFNFKQLVTDYCRDEPFKKNCIMYVFV